MASQKRKKWTSNVYTSENFVTLDFEVIANDGRYGSAVDARNGLLLACWRTPDGKYHTHWGDEYSHERLLGDVASADYIVAHNGKYEIGWLRRCGMDIANLVVFDTMLAEYVLLGNKAAADKDTGMPGVSISLDACCRRRQFPAKDPVVDRLIRDGVAVDRIPQKWLEDRCKQDVLSTLHLFRHQRELLSRTNRLPVLYTRCLLTPVLTEIEPNGMYLDKERVAATYECFSSRLRGLEEQFSTSTGGINWRSGKQVGEFLYGAGGIGFKELSDRAGTPKRTAKGLRKTDRNTLEKLAAFTDKQREFLTLRKEIGKVGSALSKNLEYFKGVCVEQDGTFRAEFNQANTATHRLSSSGIPSVHGSVQFQNLPRAFKPLFCARKKGWLVAEVDGSQLEFRIAVALSGDPQGIQDVLNKDWDAHITSGAAMAQREYGELYAAYTRGDKRAAEIRQAAKSETFKPLYGGSKGTKAQERWYKTFRERYPVLNKVQEDWVAEVLSTKRLITPWGMRYYWPRASVNNYGYVNVKASVYNYPVQALATAEIIPVALVCLRRRLRLSGLDNVLLVNTVHDSVVAEIAPDTLDTFKEQAKLAFTTDVYEYLHEVYGMSLCVPLGCGIKAGEHWGEGDEEAWNIYEDGTQERVK